MYIQLFFFTATATTEIYTYSHTLSPHDALPSCVAVRHDIHLVPVGETELVTQFGRDRDLPFAVQFHADSCRTCYSSYMIPRWSERSEEHTSELQSLMRISYAVFCLKKKTSERINESS